jgi:TonB family protein
MTSTLASVAYLAFVSITVGASVAQSATGTQTQTPQRITEGFGEGAYRQQPGIAGPILLHQVQPAYTANAERAKIQGEVDVEAIVLADGTIGATRVVKSLDRTFGLDEEALKAVQKYRYQPGMYGGKPVPSVVRVTVEFRLQAGPPPPGRTTPRPPSSYWIPDAEFLKDVARMGQPNVTMPVLERSVEPKYTSDAMRAKLTGTVTVDLVVGPDGTVTRSRLSRSLDPYLGLDRSAIEAASQWRFKPGLVNDQPANVLVTVTLEFRLH